MKHDSKATQTSFSFIIILIFFRQKQKAGLLFALCDVSLLPTHSPPTIFEKKQNAAVCAAQSCPILCDPVDSSPPGSSVHGISQARILKWVAISFSRGSSQPRDCTCTLASPALAGGFFITAPPGKPLNQNSNVKIGCLHGGHICLDEELLKTQR